MRGLPAAAALLGALVAAAGFAGAATGPGDLRLVRVGSFDAPTYVTAAPGDPDRLFVVEQAGRIRVVREGRVLRRPFLDLRRDVSAGDERGLLSMAFAPDYERSRRFYVLFTDNDGHTRVQEFRRSRRGADRADRRTRRQVLFQRQPFPNHNGGQLQFGPDGLLYVGLGDGGGAGDPQRNAQSLRTLLGKVLRIDPRRRGRRAYSIPRDNPFRGRARARGEIYAYGLRNPWRFSFDRRTGNFVLADVGQHEVEEVNFLREGRARAANFGWNVFEGRRRFASGTARGHVPPVLQRFHSEGVCSVTGGYVVRDRALRSLHGRYVYGDFCDPDIRSVRLRSGRAVGDRPTGLRVPSVSSFGEDARGRVYVASLEGPVYRIAARR